MRMIFLTAAMLALGLGSADAQTPQPADWTTLTMTANLNAGADAAWEKIGGNDWCAIAKYLDVKGCTVNSGKGELGSVRTIATATGSVVEIVAARTARSYTYAQPFTPIFYHGTLAVEPVDRTHSKLVYTLIWNQTAVGDAAAQAAARESRKTRFQAAVDKMAGSSERAIKTPLVMAAFEAAIHCAALDDGLESLAAAQRAELSLVQIE